MKRVLIVFIVLCIAYFILGHIAVRSGWMAESTYITYASIAGGVASATGLISLVRPATDIQDLEVNSLKKITKAAEELQQFDSKRNAAQEEISKLEIQKEEMKLLVKKASLSLFLRDQVEKQEKRILDIVGDNRELMPLLQEHQQNIEKLRALNEEIEADKNVEFLGQIMKVDARPQPYYKQFNDPLMRGVVRFAEDYSNLIFRLLGR